MINIRTILRAARVIRLALPKGTGGSCITWYKTLINVQKGTNLSFQGDTLTDVLGGFHL